MTDAARPPSKPQSESPPGSPDTGRVARSTLIERLFARFHAIYGARYARLWAGADPDEVKRAWSEQLALFPLEQIRRAVELCAKDVPNPPTLPEFLAIVRQCYVPGPAATQVALPSMTLREFHAQQRASAERGIEQCKEILRRAAGRSASTPNAIQPLFAGAAQGIARLADRALRGIDQSPEAEAERRAIVGQSASRTAPSSNIRPMKPHRQRTGART